LLLHYCLIIVFAIEIFKNLVYSITLVNLAFRHVLIMTKLLPLHSKLEQKFSLFLILKICQQSLSIYKRFAFQKHVLALSKCSLFLFDLFLILIVIIVVIVFIHTDDKFVFCCECCNRCLSIVRFKLYNFFNRFY
jgi:hypothetical protein